MKKLILLLIVFLLFSCTSNEPALNGTDTTTSLVVSPGSLSLGSSSGPLPVSIKSNTTWTVYMNNAGASGRVPGLSVSPLSGSGNGTLSVDFPAMGTTYYDSQNAVIVVYYYSKGVKLYKEISVIRKGRYLVKKQ